MCWLLHLGRKSRLRRPIRTTMVCAGERSLSQGMATRPKLLAFYIITTVFLNITTPAKGAFNSSSGFQGPGVGRALPPVDPNARVNAPWNPLPAPVNSQQNTVPAYDGHVTHHEHPPQDAAPTAATAVPYPGAIGEQSARLGGPALGFPAMEPLRTPYEKHMPLLGSYGQFGQLRLGPQLPFQPPTVPQPQLQMQPQLQPQFQPQFQPQLQQPLQSQLQFQTQPQLQPQMQPQVQPTTQPQAQSQRQGPIVLSKLRTGRTGVISTVFGKVDGDLAALTKQERPQEATYGAFDEKQGGAPRRAQGQNVAVSFARLSDGTVPNKHLSSVSRNSGRSKKPNPRRRFSPWRDAHSGEVQLVAVADVTLFQSRKPRDGSRYSHRKCALPSAASNGFIIFSRRQTVYQLDLAW